MHSVGIACLVILSLTSCTVESDNPGGEDSELTDASAAGDAASEESAGASMATDGEGAEIWNACLWQPSFEGDGPRILYGVPELAPKVSDAFENLMRQGYDGAIEPTDSGAVVRLEKFDNLTRKTQEISFELTDRGFEPPSDRCGPRTMAVTRAMVDGEVASEMDMLGMVPLMLGRSDYLRELRDKAAQSRIPNESSAEEAETGTEEPHENEDANTAYAE